MMEARKEPCSTDDYIALYRGIHCVAFGRYSGDDPTLSLYDHAEPEYCLDIPWFCWRETSANGEAVDTSAMVSVLLDSNRRHASGVATVSFRAKQNVWCDAPNAAMRGGERLAILSAWIEADGLRVSSDRTSEEGLTIAEVSDDVAIDLLQKMARGGLPAIKLQFAGEPCGRIFQVMRPVEPAQRIEAQLCIVKQALAAKRTGKH